VYELPHDLTAADVLGFLRANVPDGWTEPTDATCARRIEALPLPPAGTNGVPVTTPNGVVLLQTQSQLTVFAPGQDGAAPPDDDGIDGVTFTLSRDGDSKLLSLDSPTFSCGVPQPDRQAEEFDHGPTPVRVVPTVPP